MSRKWKWGNEGNQCRAGQSNAPAIYQRIEWRSRLQCLYNLKLLFSCNEEIYVSKEVKENALASEGKSHRPDTTTVENQYACQNLSVWNKRQKSNLLSQSVDSFRAWSTHQTKNSLEQEVFWHEVKVVCCPPTPFLHSCMKLITFQCIYETDNDLAGRFWSAITRFVYRLQCSLLN